MAKLNREGRVREKRAEKAARKAARRLAAAGDGAQEASQSDELDTRSAELDADAG